MLLRSGLLLALAAICLQIAVFLQPLLPPQYQIAPVCEKITQALLQPQPSAQFHQHHSSLHVHESDQHDLVSEHHHTPDHQCQYCTVYGHLVLPPELGGAKQVLVRILIRLVAYQQEFQHIFLLLQRLFLLPLGRAPPQFI